MATNLPAYLTEPVAVMLLLAAGAAIGVMVEKITADLTRARKRTYWQGRNAGRNGEKSNAERVPTVDFAAEQLKARVGLRPCNRGKPRQRG